MGHPNKMDYRFRHGPLPSHLIVLTCKLFRSAICLLVSQKVCLNTQLKRMSTTVLCAVVRDNRMILLSRSA